MCPSDENIKGDHLKDTNIFMETIQDTLTYHGDHQKDNVKTLSLKSFGPCASVRDDGMEQTEAMWLYHHQIM